MQRSFTQKEIYDYLLSNPLNTAVHIGDLEDMQGADYIFLDYLNDDPILRDNDAYYQTVIQISVYTRDFEDRKTLTNYIKQKFLSSPTYSHDSENEYYVAIFTTGILLNEDTEHRSV